MGNNIYDQLNDKYPFLTICDYSNTEYIGIVQNQDDFVTTIYDFDMIPTIELKKEFLRLGETWWWESNRCIPINIFLKSEWDIFNQYTKTFNNKTLTIVFGPVVNLNNIMLSKKKRRTNTMVKRPTR